MPYQAILFDIDGTLIDSFPPYSRIISQVLKKYHKSVSLKDLKNTFSMSLADAFHYLGIPQNQQGPFERDYMIRKMNYNQNKPDLFPGITEMFEGLSKSTFPGVGIVTSGGDEEVKSLTDNYSVMNQIWTAVTADTIPYHKPAPEPLLYAADQMGVSIDKVMYVGDALVDQNAARNAKMDFGIAGWGADPKVHFTKYKYRFKRPQDILKLF